jgi:hypothetical protein
MRGHRNTMNYKINSIRLGDLGLALLVIAGLLACGGCSGACSASLDANITLDATAPQAYDGSAVIIGPDGAILVQDFTVSPGSATVPPFGHVTFTAPIPVTWAVGEPSAGTITDGGLYTASAVTGTFHVIATSVEDPSKHGAATVTVVAANGQGCSPVGPPSNAGTATLPADRATFWQPGVSYNGGIPCRATNCATLSPSGSDDTQAINNALAKCAKDQTVQLKAGTYKISGNGVEVPANVTLRGEVDGNGRPASLLVRQDGQPFSVIAVGSRYSSDKFKTMTGTCAKQDPASCGINLAADAPRGSSTLTLASNPGLSVGEIVYVDMATDPNLTWWNPARSPGGGQGSDPSRGWFSNYDRPIAQVMEVQAISGNTISFTTPFHINFTVANKAQLWQYSTPATKWAGVENVYTYGGGGGDGGGDIHFYTCAYCWAKNVEADFSNGTAINLDGTFRSEVRDSYSHTSADPNPGGGGYLMGMNRGAADNLFENNISWNGNKVIVMRATGGGNVIAYNYMQDSYGAGYKTIPEIGLNAAHMTTPHYELFEGNESSNFDADSVWGGSIYITVFRNSFTGLRISAPPLKLTDQAGRHAAGNQEGHWWYTFIGNVLGFPDMTLNVPMPGGNTGQTSWAADATGAACGNSAVAKMWCIGWDDNGNWGAPQNPLVLQRTIRDGNYDFVSKAIAWASGEHPIPDSLYLGGPPAFFGSSPWPWVDPLTGTTHALPAKVRWNAMVSGGTHRSPLDVEKGI